MELIDVYTPNRVLTGRTVDRDTIPGSLGKDDRILLVHICVFNYAHKMLIQQRSHMKDRYPLQWDVSAGGFVKSGDGSFDSVKRELKEEIGLECSDKDIVFFRCEPFHQVYDDFYIAYSDLDEKSFTIQEEELECVKWESEDEILRMITDGRFVDYDVQLIKDVFSFERSLSSD